MTPHLDSADIVTRRYAAEQSAAARDRKENERRIREQLADGSAGVGGKPKRIHCGICGSPFGDRAQDRNACADCRRQEKQVPPGLRDKMSPEELHPEHFSEDGEDQ